MRAQEIATVVCGQGYILRVPPWIVEGTVPEAALRYAHFGGLSDT